MKKIIYVILLIAFTGCSSLLTVYVPINSTIPPRMQQQINTSANKTISFQFTEHPKAELIKVEMGVKTYKYRINKPLKSLYRELVETKFVQVTPNSNNKISITITDFNATNKNTYQVVNMSVAVQLQDGNRKDKRTFSYQTTANLRAGYGVGLQSKSIDKLLQKFIVATAKYMDTFYGIK